MLTVMKFGAPWCAACNAIQPALKKLEADEKIRLFVHNVEDDAELAKHYGIRSLPTMIVTTALSEEIGRAYNLAGLNKLLEENQ